MVIVKKTIRSKIIGLTKLKESQLSNEYLNIQKLLKLEANGVEFLPIFHNLKKRVYSANLQQCLRYFKAQSNRDYPISLRKDLIDIKKSKSGYFVKLPTKQRRGGLKVMIQHKPFDFENYEICESKLYKKKDDWFVNITVQKEVELNNTYTSVLAIDIGEKVMATTVSSANQRPTFYGREIRGIRRHYSYLRKQLGRKKLLGKIKDLSNKESRKVSDILHKISKEIVSDAMTTNSVIVLGDLKGIRNSAKGKGKRFNRIVSNMPYYQLTQMIEYKANWNGIAVMKVSEAYTSKTCSRCKSGNTVRTNQSNFKCKDCGYQINADFNGAKNILNRSLGYMLKDGALSEQAQNQSLTLEAPPLARG